MTDTDRQHLARILGMLGSDHAGERAAAGLQAEAFRRKHGLTWEELTSGKTIYIDREIVVEKPVYIDREVPVMVQVPDRRGIPLVAFDRYVVVGVLAVPFLVAMIAAYLGHG